MKFQVQAFVADPTKDLRDAITVWAINSYQRVRTAVERNITGRVLKGKVGGPLFKSIGQVSRVLPDGFIIGTNLVYGRAWELGFHRKAYDIVPVNKSVLRFGVKVAAGEYVRDIRGRFDEHIVYTKKVHIPAQTFPAKPFIRPAIEATQERITKDLVRAIRAPLKKAFEKQIVLTAKRVE